MTFIVVPHGGRDLNTRSFEIPYRRVRLLGVVALLAVIAWIAMAGSWFYVSARAARVGMLQREVARLEADNARVDQLADALRRLEAQYDQVRSMLGADRADADGIWLPPRTGVDVPSSEESGADSVAAMLPTDWPLSIPGYVTREHLGGIPGRHPGIDIAVATGTDIHASGRGVIKEAGDDRIYGKFVRIRHSEGYETVYGHASQLFVATDDSVQRHQVIALSGSTGISSAPHLHFEIWKDGEPIDPLTRVAQPGSQSR